MSVGKIFVDTNILVYAHDLDAGHKHQIALNILIDLWHARTGVLSTQVLQEFYVTMTRKVSTPMTVAEARSVLRDYFTWHIEVNDAQSILMASRIEEVHKISFWDALIVAAAANAKVMKILTEDLQPGQLIEGIQIENPFLPSSRL